MQTTTLDEQKFLFPWDKGAPPLSSPLALEEIGGQGWNILAEDLPLPVAVILEEALNHNRQWMRDFLSREAVQFAPHGKTSMSPELFRMQMEDGAWALTLSTAHQFKAARSAGHSRIFLANQLIGRSAIELVLNELQGDPQFDFYCLVDSIDNAAAIATAAEQQRLAKPVQVLVELGYLGGRTGCRTAEDAMALARFASESPNLCLAGIEGFEGLLNSPSAEEAAALVTNFLDRLVRLAEDCAQEALFDLDIPILSAGGSAYYDLVAPKLRAAKLGRTHRVLLRSGCYITHDSMMYTRAYERIRGRNALVDASSPPQPALEVWAYVQSRPEVTKAIIALGKRDISHDELPLPLKWFRPGGVGTEPVDFPSGFKVTSLNDQHLHLSLPDDLPLRVGDMVGFGVSHPCLTFDKWRVIHLVDRAYGVKRSIRTFF